MFGRLDGVIVDIDGVVEGLWEGSKVGSNVDGRYEGG